MRAGKPEVIFDLFLSESGGDQTTSALTFQSSIFKYGVWKQNV